MTTWVHIYIYILLFQINGKMGTNILIIFQKFSHDRFCKVPKHSWNYGLLSLLNPSSLHADFVICNNLRSPTVESAEASEPLLRSSWKINKLWGWLLAEMGNHLSGEKTRDGKMKTHPLSGEIEIVPLIKIYTNQLNPHERAPVEPSTCWSSSAIFPCPGIKC